MERLSGFGGVGVKVLAPVFGRIGAFVVGVLVTEGVAQEHADLFVNLLGASAMVLLDIVLVKMKRAQQRKEEK